MLIDHTFSPGVTREFVAKSGMGGPVVEAGQRFEAAMTSCPHCGSDVLRHPLRKREREWCRKCDAYICDNCAAVRKATGVHKTLQQTMNELYDQAMKGTSI